MTPPRRGKKLVLYVDGGSRGNPGPAAAGVALREQGGGALLEAGYLLGRLTNNQAEYRALQLGVEAARRGGGGELSIYSDSELMVKQLRGTYRVRTPALRPFYERARELLAEIPSWTIEHVRRERNRRADELANLALDAGEDVVEVDQLAAAAVAGPPTAAAAALEARVETAPDPAVCPAPCAAGTRFAFDCTVPEGLCLEPAGPLLEAVRACRESPAGSRRVTCPKAGCCGVFSIGG